MGQKSKMKRYKKVIDKEIELAKHRLLSVDEEDKILKAIKKGDIKAIEVLVDSHEYVILKILREMNVDNTRLSEIVSFVKEALKRLATKDLRSIEPEEFSKHSYWWIVGAANEFLNQE